jgi:hypothetical protein
VPATPMTTRTTGCSPIMRNFIPGDRYYRKQR